MEYLNDFEMMAIVGGSEPIKPKSRPIEQFDDENKASASSQSTPENYGQTIRGLVRQWLNNL